MPHAALLAVPAFGTAAWVAWEWVGRLEAWERGARRRRVVDDWERKVQEAFERDGAEVRAAVQAAGVQGLPELREALSRVADADAVVAEWRRRIAEWQASPEAKGAAAERAEIEGELRRAEAKLAEEVGGFVRDPRSIEAENPAARGRRRRMPGRRPRPLSRVTPAPGGDPLRALVERAAAETGATPAALVRGVAAKASQILSALSFQRLQALGADDRASLAVQMSGRAAPVAALPPADRDLVHLSLKLALLEQALAAGGAVAFADDAFAGLSDGARRVRGAPAEADRPTGSAAPRDGRSIVPRGGGSRRLGSWRAAGQGREIGARAGARPRRSRPSSSRGRASRSWIATTARDGARWTSSAARTASSASSRCGAAPPRRRVARRRPSGAGRHGGS